jgi:hypothetical protein
MGWLPFAVDSEIFNAPVGTAKRELDEFVFIK